MKVLQERAPFKIDNGREPFQKNIRCKETFGDNEYFKTIFMGGEGLEKEMEEDKRKEYEDWKSKVVVGNPHFQVNQRQPKKPH